MRPFDDYPGEMSDPLAVDDAAAEALLAGREVVARQDLAPLSAFIAEMRACRSVPVPAPSPALALLLRDGASVAPSPTGRPPRPSVLPGWRRRLALAGVGLGAALTGVVGASAADLLPESVERAVATVVETLTPLEMLDRADGSDDPAGSDPGGGPAGEVPPGPVGAPRDDGAPGGVPGAGAGSTSPTGTSPGPAGGAPAGPSAGGPAGPGGSTGAPGSGGVAVPNVPAPPAPGAGTVPSVPTTLPAAPPVPPPTMPGAPTVPTTPTAPQFDPSEPIPLPW